MCFKILYQNQYLNYLGIIVLWDYEIIAYSLIWNVLDIINNFGFNSFYYIYIKNILYC